MATIFLGWTDHVVPVTVEVLALDVDAREFGIGHLDPSRVGGRVELAAHLESGGGRSVGDQIDDYLVAGERPATPVLGDAGEQVMLNLVPRPP